MPAEDKRTQQDILIDGHAHIHDCFSWPALLDAANVNFGNAGHSLDLDAPPICVLLLCDDIGYSGFARLSGMARKHAPADGWSFRNCADGRSVVANSLGGNSIFIIAGHQIRTREGLEVLALCSDGNFANDRSLEATLDLVTECGGVPVIPWGFGKWVGRRGQKVREILRRPGTPKPLLGDNGGRLAGFRDPPEFAVATQAGIGILAGSDPLPFRGEERRAAAYGTHVRGHFDAVRASASLRHLLRGHTGSFRTFGNRERPVRFLSNQVRMQLRKRLRRGRSPS